MNDNIEIIAARLQTLHEDVGDMKGVLRELTRAVTTLAVVEERQAQTAQSLDRVFNAVAKIEARLAQLEIASPLSKQSVEWVNRAMLFGVGATAMYVLKRAGFI